MENSVVVSGVYRHFKGRFYRVVAVGRSSETLELCVVYEAVDKPGDVWVRPLRMFEETVVVDGKGQKRFELVEAGSVEV